MFNWIVHIVPFCTKSTILCSTVKQSTFYSSFTVEYHVVLNRAAPHSLATSCKVSHCKTIRWTVPNYFMQESRIIINQQQIIGHRVMIYNELKWYQCKRQWTPRFSPAIHFCRIDRCNFVRRCVETTTTSTTSLDCRPGAERLAFEGLPNAHFFSLISVFKNLKDFNFNFNENFTGTSTINLPMHPFRFHIIGKVMNFTNIELNLNASLH